jgi:hypothetical protein
VAAVAVAVIALAPVAWYLRAITPVTTRPVEVPLWFQSVGRHLTDHQVLLVLPAPSVREAPLTWQAVDRMPYVAALGSGPSDDLSRAGAFTKGEAVLYNASTALYPQAFEPGDTRAVRDALAGWGVTTVVIPDQPGLPIYDQVTSVPFAVALLTAASGRPPVHQESAWVWYGLDRDHASIVPVTTGLTRCTDRASAGSISTEQLASCVLDRGGGGPSPPP